MIHTPAIESWAYGHKGVSARHPRPTSRMYAHGMRTRTAKQPGCTRRQMDACRLFRADISVKQSTTYEVQTASEEQPAAVKVKVEVKVNAPALGVDRALDAVFKRAAFRNRRKGRAGLLFAKSVAYVAGCRGPPMKANGQQSDKHTCGKAMAAHHTCPRPAAGNTDGPKLALSRLPYIGGDSAQR